MASKNIKGITIEIDGNTQPLSNALKDLNKDINSVNKELRSVDQALKLDPGNAEQVARKLELLEEKAELAEKRVEALKQAQAKMDAEGVDKASKEYQSLTTEIAKAEGEFRNIQTQIERTGQSFNEVTEGSKQLDTFLKATGQSADDLTSILGSKLVDAIKSGQLGAAGYQTVLDKLATSFTGSKANAEEFRKVLSSIDDGGSLDKVRQELEQIGNVQIGGLGAEFENLSQKSTQFDTELKQINESLKLDPSNLDLVAQKQEVLSQSVATSEQKLQALNQRFSELKANNVDLNDEEFRNLQREIANTEAELNGYRSNLSDLENAQQRLNTYFEATGTSVRDFSNVLGSDLVAKIERGEASSQELANALDKIGASATQNRGDIDRLKNTLDSIDSGVSLTRIKSELEDLGSKSQNTKNDVGQLGEELKNIGQKLDLSNAIQGIEGISEVVSGVADKVGEIGEASLEASSTVQDSTNKVKIGLGETGEEAERSGQIIKDVFANNFGESMDDVTEKFVYLKQALGDSVDPSQLQPLLEQFITLDDNGMDFNETVRATKNLMQAFGVDSQTAMDVLTTGMQHGLNYTDELGDNLAEYAGRWAEAGTSLQDYMSMLEEGTQNGAYNLDKVGDFLNEFLTSLGDGRVEENIMRFGEAGQDAFWKYQDGTASAQDVLNAFAKDLQDMPEVARQSLMSDVWSSLGEDNMQGLILSLGNVENKYGDVSGAAEQAAANNSNSVEQMSRTWETFKLALAPIGEALAGIGNSILQSVLPAVESFGDTIKGLFNGEIDPKVLFEQIKSIGSNTFDMLKEMFPQFKENALEAIKNFADGFLDGLPGLLSNLGEIGGKLIQGLMEWLPKLLEFGVQIITTIAQSLVEHAPELLQGAAELIGKLFQGFIDGLPQFIQGTGQLIGTILTALGQLAGSLIQAGGQIVLNIINGIGPALGQIGQLFVNLFSGLWDLVSPLFQPLIDGIKGAWDGLWSGLESGWESIKGWFGGIFSGLNLQETWNTTIQSLGDSWNTRWSELQAGWDSISSWFSTIFEGLNLGEMWNTVTSSLSDSWNTRWSEIQTGWDSITGWFSTIFSGINLGEMWNSAISGISDAWNALWSGVQSFWETISGWFSGIFSSLGLSDLWNEAIGTISSAWDTCWNTVKGLWDSASQTLSSGFDSLKNGLSDTWNNLCSGLGDLWDKTKDTLTERANTIKDNLSKTWDSVKETATERWNTIKTNVSETAQALSSTLGSTMDNIRNNCSQAWDNVRSKAGEIWNNVTSTVTSKAEEIRGNLQNKWNEVVSNFSQIWGSIQGKASEIWENVKRTVQEGVNRLKDLMNFHWELPKIQLPHFNISGSFSLNPPSVPSFSIDWYKKGGILTAPTIFGANGNTLLGGGEAGKEAVAPIDTLTGYVEDAVNSSNAGVEKKLESLIGLMSSFCDAALNKEFNLNIDGRSVASAIAPQVDRELGMLQQRKRRQ